MVRPDELAAMLGVTLPPNAASATGGSANGSANQTVEPVSRWPRAVVEALGKITGDRSADTMRIVGACKDSGLTLAQTRYVVGGVTPLAERLAERTDDDVLTCWLKAVDARQNEAWVDNLRTAGVNDGYRTENAAASAFEANVELHLDRLRARREAQRRLDDEERPPAVAPAVKSLDSLLAEPDAATRYRIDKLAPDGGRTLLSAQYKAGKTTLVGNLLRSLADAEPFLGAFAVNGPARRAVLIDNELSENTVRAWMRDQRIVNTAAIADVVTLRGNVAAFNLLDDRRRDQWARRLADLGCDYLILDCLRPLLDALGLDENRDAGKFLVAFDALLADAGIPDALLTHHMGHSGERSRGDSRLQDWPDAIWKVVREAEDPASPRFFSAYGRDVAVPEGRLSFDLITRRLSYAAGSRTDAKTELAYVAVIELLAEAAKTGGGPMSQREVERALEGEHSKTVAREALSIGVRRGVLAVADGPNRSKLHRIAFPCAVCGKPVTTGRDRHETCPAKTEGLFE